jgi:hypothetical protein
MSFKAIDILALIPVLVSVIAIIVANRAVTRSLRPVLVFVCEVRDKVWCVQNVGTGPGLDVVVAEKDRDEQPWARFKRLPPYRGMEKSSCDPPRVFLRLSTTTLRTTLIRRSAQGIGIDFRRAMFLMNLMRTRLLFTQNFPRIQAAKVRLLSRSNVEEDGDLHIALQDATGDKPGVGVAEIPAKPQWCELRQIVFGWTQVHTRYPSHAL